VCSPSARVLHDYILCCIFQNDCNISCFSKPLAARVSIIFLFFSSPSQSTSVEHLHIAPTVQPKVTTHQSLGQPNVP